MKKYVVLDTNIIVSFFEGGFSLAQQNGVFSSPEDIIILKHLLNALDRNQINLILPEVVILESERIKEEKKEELGKLYIAAIKGVNDAVIPPNKIIAMRSKEKIKKTMEDVCAVEKAKIESAWKIFQKICKHKNTHTIKLDEKVVLNAYKRGLMGKRPYVTRYSNSKDPDFNNKPIHDIQPDCIIVECIKLFLRGEKNFELYLGTNDNGFFTTKEKQVIHPDIQKELNFKGFYLSLSDLLNKVLGVKTPRTKKIASEQKINAYPLPPKSITEEGKVEGNFMIVKGQASI